MILKEYKNKVTLKGMDIDGIKQWCHDENIPLFRDFLIKNFKKSQLSSSKVVNLYLDSVIDRSALNEDFYSEIEILAPFGSGNSEPKFVI